eukprot:2226406-Rhodomonas_salina.1
MLLPGPARSSRREGMLPSVASYAIARGSAVLRKRMALHPEIHHKKPQFQYSLYQERGFLYLISGCTTRPEGPSRFVGTGRLGRLRYQPTRALRDA